MTLPTEVLLIAGVVITVVIVFAAMRRGTSIMVPAFGRRSLMNKSEIRVFKILQRELPESWLIMCQVSYGAFLKNKSFKRYMTVNSKRADYVLVSPDLVVTAVIEYQGSGHFGNTTNGRDRAVKSDRIKRQALKEANILLFEAPANKYQDDLQEFVRSVVSPQEIFNKGADK